MQINQIRSEFGFSYKRRSAPRQQRTREMNKLPLARASGTDAHARIGVADENDPHDHHAIPCIAPMSAHALEEPWVEITTAPSIGTQLPQSLSARQAGTEKGGSGPADGRAQHD